MATEKTASKKKPSGVPAIQWRKRDGYYVVTNDSGSYVILSPSDFKALSEGKIAENSPLREELVEKGFIRNLLNFDVLSERWRKKNSFLFAGPGLHIFVMTLRCNHKCLYCQSGAIGEKAGGTDMSWNTARLAVDFAFKTPRKDLTIEFQGGEPLINWPVLKKTVEYARQKEKKTGKKLTLALVSNFSLMDEKKAEFLLKNEVSICTSLDGPAKIHNAVRIFSGGNSHAQTVKWLSYFKRRHDTQNGKMRIFKPSALLTVSKQSLGYPKEIVDEYVRYGLENIYLRPLSPIGYARKHWDKIGYTPEEFLQFYSKALKYIVSLSSKGVKIREKTAQMAAQKIFNYEDPGFLDLRCPCGAGIGQIAYTHDGSLYTCDEGRMVAWEGDSSFRIGDVRKSSYKDIMNSDPVKSCVMSSNLELQPMCFRCAYRPYCGVCPVVNYESQGGIWGDILNGDRCALYMGVFDSIFDLIRKPAVEKIFRGWVSYPEGK